MKDILTMSLTTNVNPLIQFAAQYQIATQDSAYQNQQAKLAELTAQRQTLADELQISLEKQPLHPVITDFYHVAASNFISDDARDYSCYQVTFRRPPKWMTEVLGVPKEDQRFIFYGIQDIVNNFFRRPITQADLDEAKAYYAQAKENGQPVDWDADLWQRVIDEHDGWLPVKITALPEGSTFYSGEPVIQIEAGNGFGELAAWFETKLLQVWQGSEIATMSRHWLEYNENLLKDHGDKNIPEEQLPYLAKKMTADFSDRSSVNPQDSANGGVAWLTSHRLTSTTAAGHQAWKKGGESWATMSSLAHRVVQSFKREGDAYKALYNVSSKLGEWGSYVADCYDYKRAVEQYLIPLALEEASKPEDAQKGVICARPDSGDPYEMIQWTFDMAVKVSDELVAQGKFDEPPLYDVIETRDGRTLKSPKILKTIEADGMSFASIIDINNRLIEAGYTPALTMPTGIGGYFRDEPSRGNMSVAMKLASVGLDSRPVMKFAPDSPGKESIPGKVKIVREAGKPSVRAVDEAGKDELITWYDGTQAGNIIYEQAPLSEVQARTDGSKDTPKPSDDILSPAIQQLKQTLREDYLGNMTDSEESIASQAARAANNWNS